MTDKLPDQTYTVGVPYKFAPVRATYLDGLGKGGEADNEGITFTLEECHDPRTALAGKTCSNDTEGVFLIDPKTGVMQGTPLRAGVFNLTLYAVDGFGERAPVQTIAITVIDPVPDTPAPQTALHVAVALGGTFAAAAALAAAAKWRERRARDKPFNFRNILAQMQADGLLEAPGALPSPPDPERGATTRVPALSAEHGGTTTDDDDDLDGTAPLLSAGQQPHAHPRAHPHSKTNTAALPKDLITFSAEAAPSRRAPPPPGLGDTLVTETSLQQCSSNSHGDSHISNHSNDDSDDSDDGDARLLAPPAAPATLVRPREIPGRSLRILTRIGGGNFGDVFAGMLDERSTTGIPAYRVAVKAPKPDVEGTTNKADLLQEAALMAQFCHPNIVALIGIVSRSQQCKVVLQYCDRGSLQSLLREDKLNRGESVLPEKVALVIAAEIAAGMSYLESKRFVHRDLAARNILVGADDTCLVADFGLSRALRQGSDYYKVREGVAMPIRWSAPEVVDGARYTSASDVWSFFVLMWEVWSRAQVPFGVKSGILVVMTLQDINEGVLEPDDVLDRPDHVEEQLYRGLQALCWAAKPADRASFSDLCGWIRGQLGKPRADAREAAPPRTSSQNTGPTYQRRLARGARPYNPMSGGTVCQTRLASGAQTYNAVDSASGGVRETDFPADAEPSHGRAAGAAYGTTRRSDLATGPRDNLRGTPLPTGARPGNNGSTTPGVYGNRQNSDLITGLYDNLGRASRDQPQGPGHQTPLGSALHSGRRGSDVHALVSDNGHGAAKACLR